MSAVLLTIGQALWTFLLILAGLLCLVVLVYVLVRIGAAAFFQAKFHAYRNRNKNKS